MKNKLLKKLALLREKYYSKIRIREILNLIKSDAARGKNSVRITYDINEITIAKLQELGFTVEKNIEKEPFYSEYIVSGW